MLRKELESLVQKYGPPARAEKLDEGALNALRVSLPEDFVAFVAQYGIGTWLRGKFQFCRSDLYAPVCSAILAGDKEFRPERSAIFGFTAFGEVFVWNRDLKVVLQVDLASLIAFAHGLGQKKANPELDISDSLAYLEENDTDIWEDSSQASPLFARAVKKLGELNLGEVYGFVPALAIGGSAKLTSLRRLKGREHLALLAQAGRARFMSYDSGSERFIRLLGSTPE